MPAEWVTLDKFEELTGVNREFARKECTKEKDPWPEFTAWDKLSPKIYLINIAWWNKWRETAAASKRRQTQALRSNFNTTGSDAGNASSASPRLPTLED